MKGLAFLAAALCVFAVAAAPFQKTKSRGDVQILDAKGHRGEEKVVVSGRVRAVADKQVHGLVLAFDFLADSGDVLTTMKAQISDEDLDNGDEFPIHAETMNPPGSIRFRIRAYDSVDKELRVIGGGPYIID